MSSTGLCFFCTAETDHYKRANPRLEFLEKRRKRGIISDWNYRRLLKFQRLLEIIASHSKVLLSIRANWIFICFSLKGHMQEFRDRMDSFIHWKVKRVSS